MNPLNKNYQILLLLFLAGVAFSFMACKTGYEKDNNAVYYNYWNEGSGSHKFKLQADPKTFHVLEGDKYAKDNRHVFFEGERIKGADALSFESISEWFARDKNRGYRGKYPVISSSGASFKTIDDDLYSSDGLDVFYDTMPLHVSSANNFHFVFNDNSEDFDRWGTDGYFYYSANFKIPSNDYANVTVYKNSGGLAKDKNWVYFLDHKINFDIDGKRVIDTVDIQSFKVTGFLECSDKWGP